MFRTIFAVAALAAIPTGAVHALSIVSVSQSEYASTFATPLFVARTVQGNRGAWYSLNNPGSATAGTGGFANGDTRSFTLTYGAIDGQVSFGYAGNPVISSTIPLTDPFNTLGFVLRADADTGSFSNLVLSVSNLQINGAPVGGVSLLNEGSGFLHFQLRGLNASDFAGGFTLTGDTLMSWTSANANARPNSRLDFKIAGVNVVPEPTTWAMLIAGFGLVGASMRRRRGDALAA